MLHVDPGSVANWIDQGLLKAHRTPGGHRRVAAGDLEWFLRKHEMPIPEELYSSPTQVLVVDDEPAITQMISQTIKAAHPEYEILEAHDGFAAGTVLATARPDVVVLDLRMPGMDGFAVCQVIRAKKNTSHAHVIAITAHPSPENEHRIIKCGANVCLSKPLDMELLLREIETAVER